MDKDQIIDYVYIIMGITEEEISREIISTLYYMLLAAKPDLDECLFIYYLVLDCYTWLIRNSIANGGIAGGRIREREGALEYEEQQGQTKSYAEYWQEQRDIFEKSPNLPCLTGNTTYGKLIFGGVRVDEHSRVINNTNSLGNGYQIKNPTKTIGFPSINPFRVR